MMPLFKKSFPFVSLSERKRKIAGGVIFWTWNVLALCLIFFGLVPHVLVEIVRDSSRGLIPWSLTVAVFCLMAIPLLSVAWAVRLARSAEKWIRIFYGLEVPLCLVCLLRIFLIRELTAAVTLVAVAFSVASIAFGYELVRSPGSRRWALVARLGGHSVAALTSLYLGAILAFYVPVVAVAFAKGFFGFGWVRPLFHALGSGHLLMFLVALLFALSATLFLAAPVALVLLHGRSFFRVYRRCREQLGPRASRLVVGATILMVGGLFVVLNRQPHRVAFERLSHLPASDQERAALLADARDIRQGLVAAYLAPYRFLSARGENSHLRELYQDVLAFPRGAATVVAEIQASLLAPFLYDGESMAADRARADKLYTDFFDAPLQRKERKSVLSALAATWNRDERSAGLLNQDQRKVKLTRQEIRVDETGACATIEIHDRYQNQTREIQEIYLSFSLPESAVVTGLWLGDSEDREKRFAFKVSPRGAAQKVYRNEVAGRRDPALIEQVGPGQYRLRAFPIPAMAEGMEQAPDFHLWLTYVAESQDGRWPTPHLSERRNVYWDESTERVFDQRASKQEQEEWTLVDLTAKSSSADVANEAVVGGDYLVRREPLQPGRLASPRGERLAIVVDRSYSMSAVRKELKVTLAEVAGLARDNHVDVYFTSSSTRGEAAERIDDIATAVRKPLSFFGGGSLKEWLRQLDKLRADTRYDAVFVLTDDDTLDHADDSEPPDNGAALWIVHLGGRLAAGYDDPTLALVNRSGGGITTSLRDALLRRAARKQSDSIINVDGRNVWTWQKTASPETPIDSFSRLAARQLILTLARRASDLSTLDEIHRLAVKYGEVSTYSSMIVLVDDAQRRALEAAERQEDRFQRTVESGKEILQAPTNPLSLTATPEPHEWVLIGLALAAVGLVLRQRRRSLASL
jgi:putative PEP-CTERM system integral membrane protein